MLVISCLGRWVSIALPPGSIHLIYLTVVCMGMVTSGGVVGEGFICATVFASRLGGGSWSWSSRARDPGANQRRGDP